ncbi:MAG: bifunctional nuclease family protein [Candidatus Obscuribacterales bacterium]|nr:bifunctional nuclease family protein [Candidatus Obscuribacterales bacterium]
MLKVFVSLVGCDAQTGNPVVVLNEPSCDKMLSIWIGMPEARAISWALQAYKHERPLTHQLLFNTIESLNYEVQKVEINAIKNSAFLAKLYLVEKVLASNVNEPRVKIVDARPSDGIILALMNSAPIYVSQEVLEEAAVPIRMSDNSDLPKKERDAKDDASDELFKTFLQGLKASDFKLPDDNK